MDWSALFEYGISTVILGVLVYGLWRAGWGVAGWMKPRWEKWFDEESQLKKDLTNLAATNSRAITQQAPVLSEVRDGVDRIEGSQQNLIKIDAETTRKVNVLLANHGKGARVALVLLEAIKRHHPEMERQFDEAITALHTIEDE